MNDAENIPTEEQLQAIESGAEGAPDDFDPDGEVKGDA